MKRVVVHIDRLVLKGFPHEDHLAISSGLRTELERLLAEPRAVARLTNGGDTQRLQAGKVGVEHATTPQSVGTQAARGIAWRLKS